jgi:hypothetical protein
MSQAAFLRLALFPCSALALNNALVALPTRRKRPETAVRGGESEDDAGDGESAILTAGT